MASLNKHKAADTLRRIMEDNLDDENTVMSLQYAIRLLENKAYRPVQLGGHWFLMQPNGELQTTGAVVYDNYRNEKGESFVQFNAPSRFASEDAAQSWADYWNTSNL